MGSLQIPYMLGKFVFPMMGYKGWTGLSLAEAKAKNKPFADSLRDNWKALKVQQPDAMFCSNEEAESSWDVRPRVPCLRDGGTGFYNRAPKRKPPCLRKRTRSTSEKANAFHV